MWYFAWILGTLLACAFGVITALALEHVEATKAGKEERFPSYWRCCWQAASSGIRRALRRRPVGLKSGMVSC